MLKLWSGVSKGMLPVKYFFHYTASFYVSQMSWRSEDCCKDEAKSGQPHLRGYYQTKNRGVCLSDHKDFVRCQQTELLTTPYMTDSSNNSYSHVELLVPDVGLHIQNGGLMLLQT